MSPVLHHHTLLLQAPRRGKRGRNLCRSWTSCYQSRLFLESWWKAKDVRKPVLSCSVGIDPASKDSTGIFGWPHSLWASLCGQCPLAYLRKQAASLHKKASSVPEEGKHTGESPGESEIVINLAGQAWSPNGRFPSH